MVTIRWKILVPNEGASLCGTCIWVVVRKGYCAGEVETFCRLVGPNALVTFPVSECTGYTDRRNPDSASRRCIGFVSAASLRETEDVEIVPVTSGQDQERLSEEPWAEILDRSQFFLTFAFYSPIVRGGRGNGKRVARRLHCRSGSHESAAAR